MNQATVLKCGATLLLGFAVCAPAKLVADDSVDFFERKIRPVLVDHCYECHAGESDVIQAGLRLDHSGSMMAGGDSGKVIVPGDPQSSLLVRAMKYDGMEMPPEAPLPKSVIRDFEKWIEMGAPMPASSSELPAKTSEPMTDWQQAKSFWAFQTPEIQAITVLDSWNRGRIDSLIQEKRLANDLSPNPPAPRDQLIRRVTFDLIGLPPTAEEVDAFVHDPDPRAYRKLVDRLLADPRHAERWTRLWLDIARYAEDQAHIVGNNDSLTYPNAYLYRDWVVNSLAQDMAYDRFVRLQLAADVLLPDQPDSHLATGFLGLGPKYYRRGAPEVMADEWEDRIDTVTRGLLGLTVACARCHDHKYDPIPTDDYYALAGVFASTRMFNRPLDKSAEQKNGEAKKPQNAAHIVKEGTPRDLNVMIRGDVQKKGPIAKRRFLTVLSDGVPAEFEHGSGRLDLADSIVNRENPLTARVIVNRVWREFFGRGIVQTPSNFGLLGDRPSHPRLLDDLAVRFMQTGWSLKKLHREIVLSAAYQQSSDIDPTKAEVDADNQFLWRVPRRRLSIESYRDAILMVSGRLDSSVGGKSIDPQSPEERRRTMYSRVSRLDLNPLLARFDFPDPNAHAAKRSATNTPLQKLFMLNSQFMIQQSSSIAKQVDRLPGAFHSKIQWLYRKLYARLPTMQEQEVALEYLRDGDSQDWETMIQVLLISNEMFIVD